jgi:hypothetical protein
MSIGLVERYLTTFVWIVKFVNGAGDTVGQDANGIWYVEGEGGAKRWFTVSFSSTLMLPWLDRIS